MAEEEGEGVVHSRGEYCLQQQREKPKESMRADECNLHIVKYATTDGTSNQCRKTWALGSSTNREGGGKKQEVYIYYTEGFAKKEWVGIL